MPSLTKTYLALALAMLTFLGVLVLSGCGDNNPKSDYDPDTGSHPGDWLPLRHMEAAQQRLDTCSPCHGADLNGGISKVSCNRCHLGGPTSVHPLEWDINGDFTYALHAPYAREHGTAACANAFCHGTNLQGVAQSGPSCSSCHMGGPSSIHPPEWRDQITIHGGYVLQHGASACRNVDCHGAQLQGVFLSGPACNDCHNFSSTQLANF